MRAAFAALCLCLLGTAPAAAQQGHAGMPAQETLARQFQAIAFSNEFGGAYRRGRIVRWNGPIRVRLEGRNTSRYRDEVQAQIDQLARLSGLSIELVTWASIYNPPNMVITFSDRRGNRTLDPDAPCLTLIYDSGYVIRRVEIQISPDDPRQRRHCIAEEITQALGLADDSTVLRDSIFNDSSRQQQIAPWDALMVRVLYDPTIRPGMTSAEAMPRARDIIGRLLSQSGFTTSD
jgi:hypothetical protein